MNKGQGLQQEPDDDGLAISPPKQLSASQQGLFNALWQDVGSADGNEEGGSSPARPVPVISDAFKYM
jgi:hypothetical protein